LSEESKALKRLKKKLENEVLWIYFAHALLRGGPATLSEIRRRLKEVYGIKANIVTLYAVAYKLEAEGLVRRASEGPRVYELTEYGELQLKKAIVYLEEKLLQFKRDFSRTL